MADFPPNLARAGLPLSSVEVLQELMERDDLPLDVKRILNGLWAPEIELPQDPDVDQARSGCQEGSIQGNGAVEDTDPPRLVQDGYHMQDQQAISGIDMISSSLSSVSGVPELEPEGSSSSDDVPLHESPGQDYVHAPAAGPDREYPCKQERRGPAHPPLNLKKKGLWAAQQRAQHAVTASDGLEDEVLRRQAEIRRQDGKRQVRQKRAQARAEAEPQAFAARPQKLFEEEEAERQRLRLEKGLIEANEARITQQVAACCNPSLCDTWLKDPSAMPPGLRARGDDWKAALPSKLTCQYDAEHACIRADDHRVKIECSTEGCVYYVHHPQCFNALMGCGIYSPEQPWSKLDSKAVARKVANDENTKLMCLVPGCTGFLLRMSMERGKAQRGGMEEWYNAKWHRVEVQQEIEARRKVEEERKRALESVQVKKKRDVIEAVEAEEHAQLQAKKEGKQREKERKRVAQRAAMQAKEEQERGYQAVPVLPKNERAGANKRPAANCAPLREGKPDEADIDKAIRINDEALIDAARKAAEAKAKADADAAQEVEEKKARDAKKERRPKGKLVTVGFTSRPPRTDLSSFTLSPRQAGSVGQVLSGADPGLRRHVNDVIERDQSPVASRHDAPSLGHGPGNKRADLYQLHDEVSLGTAAGGETMPFNTHFCPGGALYMDKVQQEPPQQKHALDNYPPLSCHINGEKDPALSINGILDALSVTKFLEVGQSGLQHPSTPFILLSHLDTDAPGIFEASIRKVFKSAKLEDIGRVELFEDDSCACIELGCCDGSMALQQLSGTYIGNMPLIPSMLIDFPDVGLRATLRDELTKGIPLDVTVQRVVTDRRRERGMADLLVSEPENASLCKGGEHAGSVACHAPPRVAKQALLQPPPAAASPQQQHRRMGLPGSSALLLPGANGTRGLAGATAEEVGRNAAPARPMRVPTASQSTVPGPAELPRSGIRAPHPPCRSERVGGGGDVTPGQKRFEAPTHSADVPAEAAVHAAAPCDQAGPQSAQGKTFQELDTWLREQGARKVYDRLWLEYTDVYILPLQPETLAHYLDLNSFLLPMTHFPHFKDVNCGGNDCIDGTIHISLVLYNRSTAEMWGVYQLDEYHGHPEKVACRNIFQGTAKGVASCAASALDESARAALQQCRGRAHRVVLHNAWRLLNEWTKHLGPES